MTSSLKRFVKRSPVLVRLAVRAALQIAIQDMGPKKSGALHIPFTADREEMTVRAEMWGDGRVVHHLPIEMHGNPTDPLNGALCFRHYGWDTLEHLRRLGFKDLLVRRYHDARLGHRGQHQLLITAIKA